MSLETEKYVALLQQNIFLLKALAQQLVDCRKEFIALNLDGMYRYTADQGNLCRKIRLLHSETNSLRRICAIQLDLAHPDADHNPEEISAAQRILCASRELLKVKSEVLHLNQTHSAFLRRSGRTFKMISNLLENFAPAYAAPEGANLAASRTSERV